jgi:hypothetical protein
MSIKQLLAELDEEDVVTLPIYSLAGIKCKVSFLKHGNHFDIEMIHKFGCSHKDHDRIMNNCMSYELSEDGVKEALEYLDQVKFSKKENEFVVPEDEKVTYEELLTSKNYTSLYEDCPVCLEKTSRRTTCSHSLCLPCFLKIETCPICRKDITKDEVDN